MIGKQILNYKIECLLGEGGMGTVYMAIHNQLGRKVAVKMLHPILSKNESLRERFKNEASALAHLQHPNIITLYDYVENEEGLFLIMEYVEGRELSNHINQVTGPMNEADATNVFKQILEAFDYAHSKGVVHRDIKPSNILITSDNKVKVMDFGIAKILDNQKSLTKTGTQLGTIFYMSPEQVKGEKVDHLSDIYSLGVTFFQMVTGQCPYKMDTTEFQVYNSIVKDPLPDPKSIYPSVKDQFCKIIEKATQKDKALRFKDCGEFKNEIDKKDINSPSIKSNNVQKKSPIEVKPLNKKILGLSYLTILLIVIGIGIASSIIYNQFINTELTAENLIDYDTAILYEELNFRTDPSSNNDANIIASYPTGYEVELLNDKQQKGNIIWYHVKIDGKEGWVAGMIKDNQNIVSKNDYEQFLKIMEGGKENLFNRKSTNWLKVAIFKKAYNSDFTTIDDIKKVNRSQNEKLIQPLFSISHSYTDDIRNHCRFRSTYNNTKHGREYPPEYAVLVKSNIGNQQTNILVFSHDPKGKNTTLEFEEPIYEDVIGLERLSLSNTKKTSIYIKGEYNSNYEIYEVSKQEFKYDACRIIFGSHKPQLLYRFNNYKLTIKKEAKQQEYYDWINAGDPFGAACASACGSGESNH